MQRGANQQPLADRVPLTDAVLEEWESDAFWLLKLPEIRGLPDHDLAKAVPQRLLRLIRELRKFPKADRCPHVRLTDQRGDGGPLWCTDCGKELDGTLTT